MCTLDNDIILILVMLFPSFRAEFRDLRRDSNIENVFPYLTNPLKHFTQQLVNEF